MSRTLRVLIVEDNPADAEMILRELRRAGYDPQWDRVDEEPEYVDRLDSGLDLILVDYTMPKFNARRALVLLQESGLDLPFIIISGTIGEDQAVEVMRQGAWDYLLKDRMARLGPAVALALEKRNLRRGNAQSAEALQKSERKYRQLFEMLNEAAVLVDLATRRIVEVNPRAEELFLRTREELIGADEMTLFPSDGHSLGVGRLTSAASLTPRGHWMEAEVQPREGPAVPVQISITATELLDRTHVLALMTDITARKAREEMLRNAKNAAEESHSLASGLLTNMTREIRSPMSGLVGLLETLMDDVPEKRREVLESGKTAAISLLRLLDESERAIQDGSWEGRRTPNTGLPVMEFWD